MKLGISILGFLVILLWGLWGFFYKIGVSRIGMLKTILWSSVAYITIDIFLIIFILKKGIKPELNLGVYAILIGSIFAGAATITFLLALEKYPASIVIPLTALYPVVSTLLSIIFLGEQPTARHIAGIILGVVAGFLLAS